VRKDMARAAAEDLAGAQVPRTVHTIIIILLFYYCSDADALAGAGAGGGGGGRLDGAAA
jgi:hypothetical protein